jgi:hypothetical protein
VLVDLNGCTRPLEDAEAGEPDLKQLVDDLACRLVILGGEPVHLVMDPRGDAEAQVLGAALLGAAARASHSVGLLRD